MDKCKPRMFFFSLTTLMIPFCFVYWILCLLGSICLTSLILPSLLLARKMDWCLPFLPLVFKGRMLAKINFEAFCSIVHYTRVLAAPLLATRKSLPSFQIIGMPKAGTTSLASQLRRHPAISGLSGLSLHETMSKESHFFVGIHGMHGSDSSSISQQTYRSLFPTILTQWWTEAVLGQPWICFDACPVHACLPHVAERMKRLVPDSKIILLIRNPLDALFSAEIMLSNEMGVDLPWSLTQALTEDEAQGLGGRFIPDLEVDELWSQLNSLSLSDPLPPNLPALFYFRLASHLKCGHLDEILSSYLAHFPPENILVVSFDQFIAQPESVVRQVMSFVDAEPSVFKYKELPAGMKGAYKGKKMHPSVSSHLARSVFATHVRKLEGMLSCSLGWRGFESDQEDLEDTKPTQPSRPEQVVINLSALPEASEVKVEMINEIEIGKMRKTPCGCWILA